MEGRAEQLKDDVTLMYLQSCAWWLLQCSGSCSHVVSSESGVMSDVESRRTIIFSPTQPMRSCHSNFRWLGKER